MDIKLELLSNAISELVMQRLDTISIDADKIADTVAITILSKIQKIIQDDDISDFDAIEKKGSKHNMPHIHAEYQNDDVVIDLEGNVIEGNFPKGKMKLLTAWIEIHKEDLEANWKLLSEGNGYFKIDPLK